MIDIWRGGGVTGAVTVPRHRLPETGGQMRHRHDHILDHDLVPVLGLVYGLDHGPDPDDIGIRTTDGDGGVEKGPVTVMTGTAYWDNLPGLDSTPAFGLPRYT